MFKLIAYPFFILIYLRPLLLNLNLIIYLATYKYYVVKIFMTLSNFETYCTWVILRSFNLWYSFCFIHSRYKRNIRCIRGKTSIIWNRTFSWYNKFFSACLVGYLSIKISMWKQNVWSEKRIWSILTLSKTQEFVLKKTIKISNSIIKDSSVLTGRS